jgi:hypothetical protein
LYDALVAKWTTLTGTVAERLVEIGSLQMPDGMPWWQASIAQGGGGLSSPPNGWDLFNAGLLDSSPALLAAMNIVADVTGHPRMAGVAEFQAHYSSLHPADHLADKDAYHAALAVAVAEANRLEAP